LHHLHRHAVASIGPEFFIGALEVFGNNAVGGFQDGVSAAVVFKAWESITTTLAAVSLRRVGVRVAVIVTSAETARGVSTICRGNAVVCFSGKVTSSKPGHSISSERFLASLEMSSKCPC